MWQSWGHYTNSDRDFLVGIRQQLVTQAFVNEVKDGYLISNAHHPQTHWSISTILNNEELLTS